MSRVITGQLILPDGATQGGVIRARALLSRPGVRQMLRGTGAQFDVDADGNYHFTIEDGTFRLDFLPTGGAEEDALLIGVVIIDGGSPIDLVTLAGLSEQPESQPLDDLDDFRHLFENLFIGYADDFPDVSIPSVLLRSGQFADDSLYELWIKDES